MLKNILVTTGGLLIGWAIFSLSGRLFYGGMIILFFLSFIIHPYSHKSGDQRMVGKDRQLLTQFTLGALGYVIGGILTVLIG